jgi:hypothetical protein
MSYAPQKPTLEELLRLKRAERPAEEFWARFEAELRAKQLAALVEKPSWPALVRARLMRLVLPLSAAAVAAVAVIMWVQTPPAPSPDVATFAPAVLPSIAPALSATANNVVADSEPLPAVLSATEIVGEKVAPVLTPEPPAVIAVTEPAPSADPIVIAGRFNVAMPDGLNLSGGTLAAVISPVAALDVGPQITVLPDIFAPSSVGLPNAEVTRTASKDDVRVSEKVLRNLDEERLNASSRRLVALDAGRVSVKIW